MRKNLIYHLIMKNWVIVLEMKLKEKSLLKRWMELLYLIKLLILF